MNTHKLDFELGSWNSIVEKAISLTDKYQYVEFEFNGTQVIVSKHTNTGNLWRDHINSSYMGWTTIGPDCVAEYDKGTIEKIEKAKAVQEEKSRIEQEAYRKKEAKDKKEFEETVAGIEIILSDPDRWQSYKDKNIDTYGSACVEYAEGWAKLMQVEMSKFNLSVSQCAEKTSFQLGFICITGFIPKYKYALEAF